MMAMIGSVGPMLRRVASRVTAIIADPMKTSMSCGLPTRMLTSAVGSSGRYITTTTVNTASSQSVSGMPPGVYQRAGPGSVRPRRMIGKTRNASPRTKLRWMPRSINSRITPNPAT